MDQDVLVQLTLFTVTGFVAQMVDGTISMGYGVSAASLLLAFGVSPAAASASVHAAKVFATGVSGWSHWTVGNVVLSFARKLLIPGIVGAILGAMLLSVVRGEVMRPYVSVYLMVMGGRILYKAFRGRTSGESHAHVTPLGFIGGFCDAAGGGGWGPIVAGTLLARGNAPRTTIGSVAFAEFFVAVAASGTLLLTIGVGNWLPVVGLALGGVLAAPIAARLTGRVPTKPLMIGVGIVVILLSVRTLTM